MLKVLVVTKIYCTTVAEISFEIVGTNNRCEVRIQREIMDGHQELRIMRKEPEIAILAISES